MAKISVIIPVYNSETYLHKCVDSILSQAFTDFEVLLINDGSVDASGEICDNYASMDSRVRTYHKDNAGVSSARNLGLDYAQGEWILFIDSDDWIRGNMLGDMYNKVISENSDLVYSDIINDFKDRSEILHIAQYDSSKKNVLNNFIKSSFSTVVGMMAKKSLYELNNVRFPVGVKYCEDFYVAVRLMLYSHSISYLSTEYYCYNRQNESSASNKYSEGHYSSVQWIYADTIDLFKKENLYTDYAKALSWKLLNSEQELVLNKDSYDKFLCTHPDSHRYIWSCPYINIKIKIMMWSLSHKIRFIAEFLLWIRNLRLQYLNLFLCKVRKYQ